MNEKSVPFCWMRWRESSVIRAGCGGGSHQGPTREKSSRWPSDRRSVLASEIGPSEWAWVEMVHLFQTKAGSHGDCRVDDDLEGQRRSTCSSGASTLDKMRGPRQG